MNDVTVDHIKAACEWAKTAKEPQAIDGQTRRYNQSNWDCGTSCCIWGAAHILAGNGPATSGPPAEWAAKDLRHILLAGLMNSGLSTPDQIAAIANLTRANLTRANLTDANLTDADLTDALVMIGNVIRRIK